MKSLNYTPLAILALGLFTAGCGSQKVPPPAATADAAFHNLTASFENNDLAGMWHFLPESYQSDANQVLHEFAEQMDADLWKSGTDIFKKVEEVLRTKKNLILENEMLAQPGVAENYDHLVNMLGILGRSDLMDLQKMEAADLGRILSTTGKQLMNEAEKMETEGVMMNMPGLGDIKDMQSEMSDMKAELVSEEGDQAVVRISVQDGHDEEVEFVRVEGKWIPAQLAEEWPEMIRETREGLKEIGQIGPQEKTQIKMGMSMVDGVLDQLLAAETSEEMQNVLAGIMGMMMGGF